MSTIQQALQAYVVGVSWVIVLEEEGAIFSLSPAGDDRICREYAWQINFGRTYVIGFT